MTLNDKKIIITRAQEQTSEAREIFRKNGAEVFDLPSLVIGPPDDWAPLDEALKKIATFDWIVFSSANGVKNVEDRMKEMALSLSKISKTIQIAAVGRKTASLLLAMPKEVGFRNVIIHPCGVNRWKNNSKTSLALEQICNGKILIQLFIRGKPFLGLDYHNKYWIKTIKNLEIEERLSGIIIYGCPYLYNKIKKIIHESIPLAYSPSQIEEAQNQILSRILQSKIVQKEIDKKLSKEFTD